MLLYYLPWAYNAPLGGVLVKVIDKVWLGKLTTLDMTPLG